MVVRRAGPEEIDRLLELMTEFYAEADFALNLVRARAAFEGLLADDRQGQVWLLDTGGTPGGYLVMTFCYSMEYGGPMAVIDDLYVRPSGRGRGRGPALLAQARSAAVAAGARAMILEVAHENAAAQALYRRAGFEMVDRQPMVLPLAVPTHDA